MTSQNKFISLVNFSLFFYLSLSEITRNSTISSETGQHRSMAYSPSPLEPTVQPVSISPIPLGHTSSTLNLSPQTNTSTTGPNAAIPPPPPPPPPPPLPN